MWFLANTKLIYTGATVATLIGTDILSKFVNLSLNGLSTTFTYFASPNVKASLEKYHDDLEQLDIELKLKLVDSWINSLNMEKIKSNQSIELIYNSLTDVCKNISKNINDINEKISYHQTKWLQSWRTIDLEQEIKQLEKNAKILDSRIKLINLSRF